MELFENSDHFFVKSGQRITHIVTVSDLDKLPGRLFMFGMFCLFELKIRNIIRKRKIQWEEIIESNAVAHGQIIQLTHRRVNEIIRLLNVVIEK
ncbi:MAG TPA: hypothetical protein PLX87_10105 [Bacteroidales bacterium]|nr:hypothetical protein [Bacteroidales bacterium]HOK74471.1 hypothetical protein [Bacteroidales bacterium]HOM40515.1 hypothetical protein [Bacteroidales bacterium]HPP92914.1 hypothetical protein [Bacteroidales bacterium]